MNLTVPFFLGMIKVGEAHVELLHFLVLLSYIIFLVLFLRLLRVPSVQEKVYGA